MGKKYLIDSNAIIDFFNGSLPDNGNKLLTEIEPVISIISQIEIFSYNKISDTELKQLNQFMTIAKVHEVNSSIAAQTIALRLKYKIKLPDAIIAATAINYKLILITRNVADFDKLNFCN